MPSLNSLISTASSQSAGGERIYKSEAKKIAAQITRFDGKRSGGQGTSRHPGRRKSDPKR